MSQDADLGAAVWPTHPEVVTSRLMGAVGRAAATGRDPPPEAHAQLRLLAAQAPLEPEPFLINAAVALRRGDSDKALELLVHARQRAPRSPAARYLLADAYLRRQEPVEALAEMAVLNRLIPRAAAQLAPALAQYVQTPGAAAKVEQILAAYPELEGPLLTELASDPGNLDIILALARGRSTGAAAPEWQQRLIANLLERGEYGKAYALWARFSGARPERGSLFNPSFRPSTAPPPFNWQLLHGSGGVVEARSDGLNVLYYGRDDVQFASQTLLLAPGTHRLSMEVSGLQGDARGVHWKVNCLPKGPELLDLPLDRTQSGRLSGTFTVPAGACPAVRIELAADRQEFSERAQFRIQNLRLAGAGG